MTDEDLQRLTEEAIQIGGKYAESAGRYLSENMEDPNVLDGFPPAAVVGFGSVAAAGILSTTIGLIKERNGLEDAREALTTAMEMLSSMLNGPGIDMDVSIQIAVKEKPDEETAH